ncbi:uncharacterized protein LOC143044442 isoform X2 [Mytilus galloprovincialis]|uniref:uncharacterized protein LOC143044442 isoform X2 n=1 Tax=Mytilus galloprovincialis TaxID=29158 RepID=UPI003F7BA3ED
MMIMRRCVFLLNFLFMSRYSLTLESSDIDTTSANAPTETGSGHPMLELNTIQISTSLVSNMNITEYITKSNSILPDESEIPITKDLCQGETLIISCRNNFVIMFDEANFGRGHSDNLCSSVWGLEQSNCDNHKNTLGVLNAECREEQKCVFKVEKKKFENQCWGTTKYLKVRYHCRRKVNQEINTVTSFQTENAPRSTQKIDQDKQHNEDTNNADKYTVTSFLAEKAPRSTQMTKLVMQHDKDLEDFTIIGIVLSGALLLIFLLIGALLFKRYKKPKQQKGSKRIEVIDMNIESENRNQYNYSEVNAQSMGNNANQTVDDGVANRQNQMENDYDVSSHVRTRTENEPLTYDVHVSDNTYNVTETSGNEPKDDVNNTYDHFFGEQTEDQYDIVENKVTNMNQCNTNEDLYY